MPTSVAVHTISFRGTAGAIFMLLVTASIFYVVGFATEGWSMKGRNNIGLWRTCECYENNYDQGTGFSLVYVAMYKNCDSCSTVLIFLVSSSKELLSISMGLNKVRDLCLHFFSVLLYRKLLFCLDV